MADLQYTSLLRWLEERELETPVHSGAPLDLAERSFRANISRLASFVAFPACVVTAAKISQLRFDAATHSLYNKVGMSRADMTPERKDSVAQEMIRITPQFGRGLIPPEDGLSHEMAGAKGIDTYSVGWDAHIPEGMMSLMASVLLGAWTAFESLATDMFVGSVNHRPESLGKLALSTRRRGKSDDSSQRDRQNRPSIPVDVLAKYGFDLNNRIGYFLWREGYFHFNTFDGLRHAFKTIFPKDAKGWFSDAIFDDVATLEAMRHVLVHRAGRVDEAFRDRVRRHADLSKLNVDDILELDGAVTVRYAEAAVRGGEVLLSHVDSWLVSNQE